MQPDLWFLYRQMLRSRLFEEAVTQLWQEGHISGEMHLGTGEEGIVAGVVAHLQDDDALALDHRGTPPLVMRGVDPVLLLCEFLGHPDGLCGGRGGHMHLFSPPHLAASSGIVGASGPAAAGFALAGQQLRPGSVAVAFLGEGAMNQGMLLESLNLAAAWKLPVLFVCKDNDWAITTRSTSVSGGKLVERAQSFGIPGLEVDGSDVQAVWQAARQAMERARAGDGPTFLHASCKHLEGHFLGDPLLRVARRPLVEMRQMAGPLVRATASRKGGSMRERVASLRAMTSLIRETMSEKLEEGDPLKHLRPLLEPDEARLQKMEEETTAEIQQAVTTALEKNQ